uniref:Uncharacterized protein n=1 Tax=Romanomermis culicivorax TaxID=13658 RepID=A0A915KM24_ROMCU
TQSTVLNDRIDETRKQENEETTGITIGSLYGTVKASQSADNIFIMQKKYYRFKDAFYEKYFQVDCISRDHSLRK